MMGDSDDDFDMSDAGNDFDEHDLSGSDDGDGMGNDEDWKSGANKLKFSVIFGSISDLPLEQKNVIRIFLSSTFTDMRVERNMLMNSVFPDLKKYCQNTHRKEFQVVDMRWGIQDQASDDHSTSELCIREIINCQRESAGPTFVCLLGDRYGTRYLKKNISEDHWAILFPRIRSSEVKELLEQWYKLDTNSTSAQHILQSLSSVKDGTAQWEKSSDAMYAAMRDAAIRARDDGELSAEMAQLYIRSVTEEEIDRAGMLSSGDEHKLRCLAFIRRINKVNLEHVNARRFVDMLDTKGVDEEGQDLLNKLKDKVRENMSADNVKEYSVDWSDDGGISAKEHKEYLQKFCDDFYAEVKRLIDSAVAAQDDTSKEVHDNEVAREVLSHSKQAIDKLSKVVPRTDILEKVKTYITGDSDRPLVVHGHSGCGKTSVMASVAAEAKKWLGDEEDGTAVVLRFLGTTPSSSEIEVLLRSLNAQLQMIAAKKWRVDPSDQSKTVKELVTEFERRIKEAGGKVKQLVIILDSIDQLRKNDVAFNLSWLPEKLPKNVKFVISTLPDLFGILKSAQSLNLPSDNFVEVQPLDEQSSWKIIDKWLQMGDRVLSKDQRDVVSKAFKDRELPPLYIKLIFNILIKWTSYSDIVSIPTDIIACMDQLFSNLENRHGKLQVKLALGYLTCCPGGISQTELEDTLSIDDEFLNAVFQYHMPPVRRIPPTLWVRIKNDIGDYIVEKESNSVAAMSWYHRQFIQYATQRYAGASGEYTVHCMNTLSEYFTGKWSEKPKPFMYTEQQMKKFQLSDPSAEALRYVAAQPTTYSRLKFNGRKISVLSQLWSDELMKKDAYPNSARYIMDIEFLTGKFLCDTWSNILLELSAFEKYMDQAEAKPIEGSQRHLYRVEFGYLFAILKMYSGLLSMAALSLSAQLFSCLQDKYNLSKPVPPSDTELPNLAWFLIQLTTGKGVSVCPLLPVTKTLVSPGGMQILARQHTGLTKLFPFTYKGKSAVVAFSDEMVMHLIEDDGTISEHMTLSLPTQPDYAIYISFDVDENYIFGYTSGTFCLISIENKRVELHISEVEIEPGNDDIFLANDMFVLFYNPFIEGKDSIMFYSYEAELAVIYSMKLRKVVWYHHMGDSKDRDDICYVSLHDTVKSHVKTLVIVMTRKTEIHELEILPDGGVTVAKKENIPNGFIQNKPTLTSKSSYCRHGEDQMDILLPDLPPGHTIMISDRASAGKGLWSYYEISRKSTISLCGKLRSGVDVIAAISGSKTNMIELYSVKGCEDMKHSATFSCSGPPDFVYLAPNSDVLIVVVEKTASVYFLTEMTWPLIEVVFSYELLVDTESPEDVITDPRGYLVINSRDGGCRFWDLTAVNESDIQRTNPRLRSSQTCMHIVNLISSSNFSFVLAGQGYLWNVQTNGYLGVAPGNEEDDQLITSNCYIGDNKWQHYITFAGGEELCVVGVNLPTSPDKSVEMELLHKHSLQSASEVCIYDKGMLTVTDDTGVLHHFRVDDMSAKLKPGYRLRTENSASKPCSWTSLGFTAMEYCYADNVFIVSGDDCDPNDDDADPVSCMLIYNTANFKLMKKINGQSFSYAVYFKNYKRICATNYNEGILVIHTDTLDMKEIATKTEFSTISMLESYARDEGMYNTEKEPYFYVHSNTKGLLKLDITQYDGWVSGKGVTCLGEYPSHYGDCRLSHGCRYLAGVTSGTTAIELCKIVDDKLQLLGRFTFQGTVDKFIFSRDDKYITAALDSCEVICLKVLDSTDPDIEAEVSKLPCTQNALCQTQEEMMNDSRWTSMATLTGASGRHRTADTLYNFMKRYVKPEDRPGESKASFPLIGTQELRDSGMFDEAFVAGIYTSTINTTSVDVKSLIEKVETPEPAPDLKEGDNTTPKPHPPTIPKPSTIPNPLSTPQPLSTQKPQSAKSTVETNVAVSASLSLTQRKQSIPAQTLTQNQNDPTANDEGDIPRNLKLYEDLPMEERNKRLDGAINEINSTKTSVCNIL